MPYQGYPDGLYLVKQKSAEKGVEHYGVLDIGNRIGHPGVIGVMPVVLHQVPPTLRLDWVHLTGNWVVLGRVTDESMARERIRAAAAQPNYDLFGNNCEHFARYVATGRRESTQLQAVGIFAGLALLAIWAIASPKA
jgi:hypothetical protein